MRTAILSNINMDPVIRLLKRSRDVFTSEGYGNELGALLNKESSLSSYDPEIVFLFEELSELTEHVTDREKASEIMGEWAGNFESALKDNVIYYVSEGYLYGADYRVLGDMFLKEDLERIWSNLLREIGKRHSNVRIFPYRALIEKMGEGDFFCDSTWYMGKILHSGKALKEIASSVNEIIERERVTPKKVLILDLDNTLWKGLAGEKDTSGVELSDSGVGRCFKDLQRVILNMKNNGVILGIVSKNNEADAMEIIENHPHMILKPEDFAVKMINWDNKADNILKCAKILNLSVDSFVFFDDSKSERELVKGMIPEVTVPDFPESESKLSETMEKIFNEYFKKNVYTLEDSKKTESYLINAKRNEEKVRAVSFEDYIKGLDIKVEPVSVEDNLDRILQLFNKTNQFNITTRRHTRGELDNFVKDPCQKLFAFNVSDKFGDDGVVCVLRTLIKKDCAVISEFVMSCRVMGKNVENIVIEKVEEKLRQMGIKTVYALYLESLKNAPVSNLFDKLGYEKTSEIKEIKEVLVDLDISEGEATCYVKQG
ncbi:MAG: HAD-IIIC family phosphatase [Lachnospiraceae bacterium]|nr:HAD-IIIC family phosphatase [Lachnospiraceae bacterium]